MPEKPTIPADFRGEARPLSLAEIDAQAIEQGIPPENLRALAKIEGGRHGAFTPLGRPGNLYERHLFHEFTGGKFSNAVDPKGISLSSPVPGGYGLDGDWQYVRFMLAYQLDPIAAIKASSWGLFHVLGNNARMVGWDSYEEFVADMCADAANHLAACLAYCEAAGCLEALRTSNFQLFKLLYNGAGPNDYANRLAILARQAKRDIQREQQQLGHATMGAGDSLVRGLAGWYPGMINEGIASSRLDVWTGQLRRLVEEHRPWLVVLSMGMNHSAFSGFPSRLLSWRREAGERSVVWMLPQLDLPSEKLAKRAKHTRDAMIEVAGTMGDRLFDLGAYPEAQREADGLHFAWSEQGYGRLAAELRARIDEANQDTSGLVLADRKPGWVPPVPRRRPNEIVELDDAGEPAGARRALDVPSKSVMQRRAVERRRRTDRILHRRQGG